MRSGRCFETLCEDESILSSRAIGVNEKKFAKSFLSRRVRLCPVTPARGKPGSRTWPSADLFGSAATGNTRCAESNPAHGICRLARATDKPADAQSRSLLKDGQTRRENAGMCRSRIPGGGGECVKLRPIGIAFGLPSNRLRETAGNERIPGIGAGFREVRPAKAVRRTRCPARSERLRRDLRPHSLEAARPFHRVAPLSPRYELEHPG